MARVDELLRVDFDGNHVDDPDTVIYGGLDDPRHRERVPELISLLHDAAEPDVDRLLACVALVTWAEPAGYQAAIDAAQNPKQAPWYDSIIDRMYSVDGTFAHLAVAVDNSDELAEEKGTAARRTETLRAFVRIADSEYFDGKLEYAMDDRSVVAILDDIKAVVDRGVRTLATGAPQRFDLATQLVDVASAVAAVDESAAVDLAMRVIAVDHSYRVLNHAIAIIHRAKGQQKQVFGDYLMTVGDEKLREQVAEALER